MLRLRALILFLRTAVNACRLLLASTFLFSGFVKLNDPWGMVYKFEDYLSSFSINVLPAFFLLCMAVLLGIFESLLGLNILLANNRRATTHIITLFMTAMTALTVYIYIADPVEDCGCFGDAIILSNGATLAKNIVLLTAAYFVSRYNRYLYSFMPESLKGLASLTAFIAAILYAVYCIICLPLVDFRPYKVGTDMRSVFDRSSSASSFDVKIIYEKDGKTLALDADADDPDSTWTYVETRRTPVSTSHLATADFCVTDADGEDITDEILYTDGYTVLLIIPDLRQADEGCVDVINELYDLCLDQSHSFYCITASADPASQLYWRDHTGAEYDYYIADERMLRTVVRGNPGVVLLRDGVIIGKWSNHNIGSVSLLP